MSANASDRATERFIEVPRDTRRGIGWVLAWAGALAVLAIAAGVLTEFAYVLAAERTLSVAARAGAMEATLPRATYQSVTAAVDRRLNQYPLLAKQLQLSLLQNGTLVQSQFRQHDGDRFAITLSGPAARRFRIGCDAPLTCCGAASRDDSSGQLPRAYTQIARERKRAAYRIAGCTQCATELTPPRSRVPRSRAPTAPTVRESFASRHRPIADSECGSALPCSARCLSRRYRDVIRVVGAYD